MQRRSDQATGPKPFAHLNTQGTRCESQRRRSSEVGGAACEGAEGAASNIVNNDFALLGFAPARVDANGDGAVGEGAESAGPEVGAPYPEGAHVPEQHILPVRRRPHVCAANSPQLLVVAQRICGDGDSGIGNRVFFIAH